MFKLTRIEMHKSVDKALLELVLIEVAAFNTSTKPGGSDVTDQESHWYCLLLK